VILGRLPSPSPCRQPAAVNQSRSRYCRRRSVSALFSSSRISPIGIRTNRKLSAVRSSVPGLNRTSSTVRLSVPPVPVEFHVYIAVAEHRTASRRVPVSTFSTLVIFSDL